VGFRSVSGLTSTNPLDPEGGGGGADAGPPETTITKSPKGNVEPKKAVFKFKSSEAGSSFECGLDKEDFNECESPYRAKKVKKGRHKFQVRAIDGDGLIDETPAKAKFAVG